MLLDLYKNYEESVYFPLMIAIMMALLAFMYWQQVFPVPNLWPLRFDSVMRRVATLAFGALAVFFGGSALLNAARL